MQMTPKLCLFAILYFFVIPPGCATVAAESVPHISKKLEQAAAAELRGDNARAYELYTQATKENPDSAEAWAAFGEHLRFYAHDSKAASAAFKKALEAKQQNSNAAAFALRGLGELASKDLQDELAIGYFKKSLQALPLADTHRSLCHLYCRQRNFKAAAEQANEAVKLNPEDPIARLLYAAQLHRSGDAAEGRKQYEKALIDGGLNAQGPVHCCVIYNAAGYLGVCADNPAALKMLQRFFETPNHRHLTRQEIETDADFESLKNMPEFRNLLDRYFPDTAPPKK